MNILKKFLLTQERDDLYKLQIEKWDPVIQWFCDRFQIDITKTQSIAAPIVPINTKDILTKHFLSYNIEAVYGKIQLD